MAIKYQLKFSKQAQIDLDEAFEYITCSLKAPAAAQNPMRKTDQEIRRLQDFPLCCELCRDETLREMNYRRLVVDRYVVIYLADDTARTAYIIRVFYGGRDYSKYIR